jgi:hypothetical protein
MNGVSGSRERVPSEGLRGGLGVAHPLLEQRERSLMVMLPVHLNDFAGASGEVLQLGEEIGVIREEI